MAKHGKVQKVVMGVLAVMVLASMLLAIAALAFPSLAQADDCWTVPKTCGSCGYDKRRIDMCCPFLNGRICWWLTCEYC